MTVVVVTLAMFVSSCSASSDVTSTTTTTTTSTTTTTFPVPAGLEPAIPGHNDLSADRINVVFAPWGWDDLADFRMYVDAVVGWSGAVTGFNDKAWIAAPDDEVVSGDLGVFGFEPFRSNRDLFNVWVTATGPPEPAGWLNTEDEPFDLADMSIVTLAWDPERAVPGITSVSGQDTQFHEPEPLVRLSDDPFANVMVNVQPWAVVEAIRTTTHELGHALFGLQDEYIGRLGGDGVPRDDVWPSCAHSLETAEAWWADAIGEYDPMIDVWIEEMNAAGLGETIDPAGIREANRTGYVAGGCFGEPKTFRSAEDTLMGFESPAFGITNRRWAEQILGLWEG